MADLLPTFPYTIQVLMILTAGVILLRLSGKRSIAQLTVPEAVLMIAIGTLMIQPVASKSVWVAIYGGFMLVVGMVSLSYLQIVFPRLRKWIYGVPSVLVTNGQIDVAEMKRAKMTIDQLEMRLRQLQIGNIADVKMAVLEPSGYLSVVQTEAKKAAQKEDIQNVLNKLEQLEQNIRTLQRKK
ncbi:DUF421 domain-containing protein [Brevibacillus humidisoli]|uniref:DUF421 domain-containing protein n=1 Tax=Brevibacillus humidisoli TaxID=2895522 RepID=UPI001E62F19A|nr:YetF domain-containing protein [Brevibacillus humidisoli]UFJ42041.1 DUF421 domain-containing protein [Brevibacillus humidisoli]